MMNTIGWSVSLLFVGAHFLSVLLFGAGLVLLTLWAFKHLSVHQLWKWAWIFVAAGLVLCLLSIGSALATRGPSYTRGMMRGNNGGAVRSGFGMMVRGVVQSGSTAVWQNAGGADNALYNGAGYGRGMMWGLGGPAMMFRGSTASGAVLYDAAAQQKEEEQGKALYDKLASKQTQCSGLSDSDFELIGEYVMGQSFGAAHAQMNARIQQMMGKTGEEQMHIVMGKQAAGCAGSGAALPLGRGGMMQLR